MQDYGQAFAYTTALAGDQPIDFRFIHDTNKAVPAIKRRGTLDQVWQEACAWNAQGYGIFACINAMDGIGNELVNVSHIRAHAVDLDNLSAQQNYERAAAWTPAPSMAVQSSPGKFHVYWNVVPYVGNEFYSLHQRKLRQIFDGDGSIIDPTRVLRLPGTLNHKYSTPGTEKYNGSQPHLVTCWSLAGYGQHVPAETLQAALATVNVTDGHGSRHELGDSTLAAPSLDWCRYALATIDPNAMSRAEWIGYTAAWKQSAWSHGSPDDLFAIWSEWCARYSGNDAGENHKQWHSIRNTEVGWNYISNRNSQLKAQIHFGDRKAEQQQSQPAPQTDVPPMPSPPELDCSGELLTDAEQREWFKGCVFVARFGEILDQSGRMMNATKFNGVYGGKKFIIDGTAKVTDEAWKAATRSTLWTIPKVDHIRFIPQSKPGDIITDELGNKGVNTYRPAIIRSVFGDVTPFIRHMDLMLPVHADRDGLLRYLAHNARFPGYKIPWAPLVQSAEGVGKGVLKRVVRHVMGGPYVHFPNAQELIESGSKFNAWMRRKLFILVDEIKVDERRDMVEVLKPMISESEIEIQGKGHDQDKEDNYSNWAFFSNHKDAIPVNVNGRRFAIYFSAIQSKADLLIRGMDDAYFNNLYGWLDGDGAAIVAHWLLNYPIERGALPMRAPDTSSTAEAQRVSRSPIEQAIADAVQDGLQGFRGGWIGSVALTARLRAKGQKVPSDGTLRKLLEGLGYHSIGRATRGYGQETPANPNERAELYYLLPDGRPEHYGRAQGYE